MATGLFNLNNDTFTTLWCDDLSFVAFSGNGPHRNNPASSNVADNGPIPLGDYYIVDRASGGTLGPMMDWLRDKDKWFALYRDDGTIDDETFIDSVRRGEFRLHPLGPRRTSTGCIVLQYPADFTALRSYLLAQPVEYIPGTKTRSYGTVSVSHAQRAPDMLDPQYREGETPAYV